MELSIVSADDFWLEAHIFGLGFNKYRVAASEFSVLVTIDMTYKYDNYNIKKNT